MNIDCKLLTAVLIAAAMIVQSAPSQDAPAGGLGNTPMAPPAPVSPGWQNRPVVPGPPTQPAPASRPPSWPGDGGAESSPWVPPDQRPAPPPSSAPGETLPAGQLHPCEGTKEFGRVGQDVILESEVMPPVNEWYLKNKDRVPPDELEAQRTLLIKQRLQNRVETLLISQDAKRTIPSEGWSHVQAQLAKVFEDQELEKMMKQSGVGTRHELDLQLHAFGTSLEKEKRAFCQRELARQWIGQQIKPIEEVTYDQMLTYYRKHQDEFTKPARAIWEELMVSYSKYPSKAAAYDAIARLGNQVAAGAAFAEVAKAGSDGVTTSDGGRRDWTGKGSLICQEIDQTLFALPVGKLSPIVEGPAGFHIVRVTQREDLSVTPFLDAQVDIRKKIIRQRSEKQFDEYMAKLKTRTPVWTIFDAQPNEPQLARPDRQERRL
jgi:parvulin-like peptidyl-prolyl isomerase